MSVDVSKLTPTVRKAAVELLPDTPHSLAQKIVVLKQTIEAIRRSGKSVNPAKEAQRQKRLAELIAQLATLTQAAAKMRTRKFEGTTPSTKPLTPEEHKVLSQKYTTQLVEVQRGIEEIAKVVGKGAPAVQAANNVRAAQLVAQKESIERKKEMVDEGKAPVEPVKLDPHVVPVQRKPLALPAVFGTPTSAEVNVIMKLLSMGLKRHPKEQDEQYQLRLRAYSKRALVRLARMTIVAGQERSTVIQHAVAETLREDAPAIEAEFKMGGEVKDPSADAMDVFVDAQTPELVSISEVAPASIPALPPTEAQTDQLMEAATEIAQDLATLPAEATDVVRETLESGETVSTDVATMAPRVSSSVTPLRVAMGCAVIVGIIYLWNKR